MSQVVLHRLMVLGATMAACQLAPWEEANNELGSGSTDEDEGDDYGSLDLPGPALPPGCPPDEWVEHDVVWEQTFNPVDGEYARLVGVAIDSLGSLYVVGYTTTATQSTDAFLLKLSPEGDLMIKADYGGPLSGHEEPEAITIGPHDEVYVSGEATGLGGWIGRYNRRLELDWMVETLSYDPVGWDLGVDSAANLVAVGASHKGLRTAKYTRTGHLVWEDHEDAEGSTENLGRGVAFDSDDNVIVTGSLADRTMWLAKHDPDGERLWSRHVPAPEGAEWIKGWRVLTAEDDSFIVAAVVDQDIWLAGYDPDGEEQWSRVHANGDWDYPQRLAWNPDGRVMVAGQRGSPSQDRVGWISLASPDDGSYWWTFSRGGDALYLDGFEDAAVDECGDIVAVGVRYDDVSLASAWVLKARPPH